MLIVRAYNPDITGGKFMDHAFLASILPGAHGPTP